MGAKRTQRARGRQEHMPWLFFLGLLVFMVDTGIALIRWLFLH
jgi:hypothetical protein